MQETRSTICPNDILIWKSIMNLSVLLYTSLEIYADKKETRTEGLRSMIASLQIGNLTTWQFSNIAT